jgi:hypothetical protein
LTAYVSKDYGTVTALADTSATEMDSTNAKGWYLFDLTQGETNADALLFSGKSTTANISLVGQLVFTTPANFTTQSIDSNGRVDVIKIAGATQTARDIGASVLLSAGTGTGQLDFTSGVVKANATQWLGGTIPAVNVTGVPLVDTKYWLGTAVSTPTVAGVPNVNVKTWNDLITVALPLCPTTAGRTLDVSAGGEAGVDWANVGSPTTAVAFTGTTIAPTQKVDIETIKTQAVTCAGGVTVPAATLASTTNITAGTITTVTNLTNAPTSGDLTATMKTSVQTSADTAITANSLINAIAGYIDTEVAAIKAKTDNLPASPAATGAQMALTAAAVDAILDEVVEGTTTLRQMIRGFASALLSKASGLDTTSPVYRDIGDTKNRITATVDANGNRSAITLDLT